MSSGSRRSFGGEIFDEEKYSFPLLGDEKVDQASGFLVNALPREHVRKFN